MQFSAITNYQPDRNGLEMNNNKRIFVRVNNDQESAKLSLSKTRPAHKIRTIITYIQLDKICTNAGT